MSTIAEPYGIRWGEWDAFFYVADHRHEAHDLSALLVEQPRDEPIEELVIEVPSSMHATSGSEPPPLPPPLPQ